MQNLNMSNMSNFLKFSKYNVYIFRLVYFDIIFLSPLAGIGMSPNRNCTKVSISGIQSDE